MLLEREDELALLNRALDRTLRQIGQTVVISGEAGIGKSALARSFLKGLPSKVRVLKGACEDLSIAEPLAPLIDLAREAEWTLPDHIATQGDRLSVFSDAVDVFGDANRPTVMLIEDIHWADDATQDFLRYMARRIEDRPVLLLLTARDDEHEGRPQVRRITGALSSEQVTRIILAPLSRTAVGALAEVVGRNADEIYNLSGGNAFYVTELLLSREKGLPGSVRDSVLVRLDALTPAARACLDAVSVFPRRAERSLLEQLLPGSESLLDECVLAGLLEEDEAFVAFRHELARRAVEDALSRAKLRDLHSRLLSCLATRGTASHARLLHHAVGAGDRNAVNLYAPQAAYDAQSLGALGEAAGYFELALASLDESERDARAGILQSIAWISYQTGRHRRAVETEREALAYFITAGDVLREGDSYRRLSRFHWIGGERKPAQDYAARAIRTLASHPGPELALAHSTLAQLAMLNYDNDAVREPAEEAMKLARRFNRPDILAHAQNNLGMSLARTDPEFGRALLRESLETSRTHNFPDDAGRAFLNWAFFEKYWLEFERSIEIAEEGYGYCVAHELDGNAAYLRGTIAWNLVHQGQYERAAEVARSVTSETLLLGNGNHLFPAMVALIWCSLRTTGKEEREPSEYLEGFIAKMDEVQRLEVYAGIVAERAWLGQESRERAIGLLTSVVDSVGDVCSVPFALIWLHKLDPDRTLPTSPYLIEPVRLQIEGDWCEAAAKWEEKGAVFNQALALTEGDHDGCQRAAEIFADIGAYGSLKALLRDTRQAGVAVSTSIPRRTTAANPAGLTKRQFDVLTALNEGLSNAEIADRLFISAKTVDHHVSAILGKLDVASRGEATAKARAAGWL